MQRNDKNGPTKTVYKVFLMVYVVVCETVIVVNALHLQKQRFKSIQQTRSFSVDIE